MKARHSSLLILGLFSVCSSNVWTNQIDTLKFELGLDLDSKIPYTEAITNKGQNPHLPGSTFDPEVRADFAAFGNGVLWCNCDEIINTTYFESYSTTLDINSLLSMKLDLNDSTKFRLAFMTSTKMYMMNDTLKNWIIKTNKGNYCIFRINKKHSKTFNICGSSRNCNYAYEVKWWYQDDGTTDFRLKDAIQKGNGKDITKIKRISNYTENDFDLKGRLSFEGKIRNYNIKVYRK